MNKTSLIEFIENFLSYELPEHIYIENLSADLATELINNNYCTNPYSEYDEALKCPINKRKEEYCACTQCESHEFCTKLRKEGYINV